MNMKMKVSHHFFPRMNVSQNSLSFFFVLTFPILSIVVLKCSGVFEIEAAEAMEVEPEDLIEITEEADLIQAERFVDDSDPSEAQNSRKNKDDMRQLEERMLVMNLDEAQEKIQHEENDVEWEVNSQAFHNTTSKLIVYVA